MKPALYLLTLLVALSTAACGQSSMKKPDIHLNPNPKVRYELTLTIEGAPGPFDAVEGGASYEVINDRCVPLTPFSGARHVPRKHVDMRLTRVSDKVYSGMLHVDHVKDEDYFGLGLCRWAMTFAGFNLNIGNVSFVHSVSLEELTAGTAVTRYFSKTFYDGEDAKLKRDDNHPFVDVGGADRSHFKDPDNTFSMTLSAREKFE